MNCMRENEIECDIVQVQFDRIVIRMDDGWMDGWMNK